MALYSFFSYNVEVQYKSYLLSKAMLFTLITTMLNIILPFIVSYRSRGFWLKSYNFYEQPTVRFTYDYILVAETHDPSMPIICGDSPLLMPMRTQENCAEFQIRENNNGDIKTDQIKFKFKLNIPPDTTITSIILIVALDFQLKTTCPLHMQSLAVVHREFSHPVSGFKYNGDLKFYQISQLACLKNHVDVKYNKSILHTTEKIDDNLIDHILDEYFMREVTTQITEINSRVHYGHTSSFVFNVNIRVPEMEVRYKPSLLQEMKWAWPQYLSLVVIFYWIFNKIKCFVFNNRLVMAWKDVPWRKV